ncbi:hypothetical protein [Salinispira pacifica]
MNYPRQVFFLGAIWEITRFIVLFLSIVWQVEESRISLVRVLWFGSAQLALAIAFLMIGWDPPRYRRLVRLLAAAKVVTLVPGVAAVVVLVPGVALLASAGWSSGAGLTLIAPFIVLLIDIIFLVILLTCRVEEVPPDRDRGQPSNGDNLPDYHETDIGDH